MLSTRVPQTHTSTYPSLSQAFRRLIHFNVGETSTSCSVTLLRVVNDIEHGLIMKMW